MWMRPNKVERPVYDASRYTDDVLPCILPPMASPFDDAPTSFAITPPNKDLIHVHDGVLAFDMLARAHGRTFLLSSWRRDQALCMDDGAVYIDCVGHLDACVMRNAVYILTGDLNGRDGKRRKVQKM